MHRCVQWYIPANRRRCGLQYLGRKTQRLQLWKQPRSAGKILWYQLFKGVKECHWWLGQSEVEQGTYSEPSMRCIFTYLCWRIGILSIVKNGFCSFFCDSHSSHSKELHLIHPIEKNGSYLRIRNNSRNRRCKWTLPVPKLVSCAKKESFLTVIDLKMKEYKFQYIPVTFSKWS